jgi:hypothetical protein
MTEDPCREQKEAYQRAMQAWLKASEEARKWIGTKPLDPSRLTPSPPKYVHKMLAAYEREEEARDRYLEANYALYMCMKQHSQLGDP